MEKQKHPLAALETIGLPYPELRPGENLPDVLRELHQSLINGQIRYLNRRGVQIPVPSKDLREMGYQSVVFKSEAQRRISAEINVNGVAYKIRLDRHFNLDFEGKTPLSPVFAEPFRYILFNLLHNVICEEKPGNRLAAEEGESNLEVVTRMGHYRELTGRQHYSTKAEENCFREQEVELVDQQARLQTLRHTINPFTYVREVREPEENLSPQEFRVPQIRGYR